MTMGALAAGLVNFGVVVFILVKYGKGPLKEHLENRKKTVSKDIDEAQAAFSEHDKSLTYWKGQWDGAKAQAEQLQQDAKSSVDRFRSTTIDQAQKRSEQIKEESKLLAQGEINRARNKLRTEIVDESVALAESFLGRSLSDEDKKRLISGSIESVSHG